MVVRKGPDGASLLDILIGGFDKNEVLGGFHWRDLPLASTALALEKFESLVAEARRWKGAPLLLDVRADQRQAAWIDLEIRQAGRGIRLLIKAPRFGDWWHDPTIWVDDPMGSVREWMHRDAP